MTRLDAHVASADTVGPLVASFVDPNIFDTLGARPVLGAAFGSTLNQGAVISFGAWVHTYARAADVIGRRLDWRGRQFTIVGVMPDGFAFPDQDTDIWISFAPEMAELQESFVYVVGRLRSGVNERACEAALQTSMGGTNSGFRVRSFVGETIKSLSRPLAFVSGGAWLLWLLLLANAAAYCSGRAAYLFGTRDLQTRLGAPPGIVAAATFLEALVAFPAVVVLAVLADTAALGLLPLGDLIGGSWSSAGLLHRGDILTAAAVSAIGLTLASLPAALLTYLPLSAHRSLIWSWCDRGRSTSTVLDLVAAVQVAIATIACTALLAVAWRVWTLLRTDPGFDSTGLVEMTLAMPDQLPPAAAGAVASDIALNAGRSGLRLAITSALPLNPASQTATVHRPASQDSTDLRIQAQIAGVTDNVFDVMGVPLLAGRMFGESDVASERLPIVIDRGLAITLCGRVESCIGQDVNLLRRPSSILGVVQPIRRLGLAIPPPPSVYVPLRQWPVPVLSIVAKATDESPSVLLGRLREFIKITYPAVRVLRWATTKQRVHAELARPEAALTLAGLIGVAAMLICAVGAYAAAVFRIGLRRREGAIMSALGATPLQLEWALGSRYLMATVVSVTVGTGASILVLKVARGAVYDIPIVQPLHLLLAGFIVMSASLVAVHLGARAVLGAEPVDVLRTE